MLLGLLVAAQFVAGLRESIWPIHHRATPHVVKPPPPPPLNAVLIMNGGFEANVDGWQPDCSACGNVLVRDTAVHKFGVSSMKVVTSSYFQGARVLDIPAVGRTRYAFSAWVFQRSGKTAAIVLRCGLSTPPTFQQERTFGVASGVWRHLSFTFVTAAGVTSINAAEVLNAQETPLTFWVDGVRLHRLPPR